jgi:hypothetical protein
VLRHALARSAEVEVVGGANDLDLNSGSGASAVHTTSLSVSLIAETAIPSGVPLPPAPTPRARPSARAPPRSGGLASRCRRRPSGAPRAVAVAHRGRHAQLLDRRLWRPARLFRRHRPALVLLLPRAVCYQTHLLRRRLRDVIVLWRRHHVLLLHLHLVLLVFHLHLGDDTKISLANGNFSPTFMKSFGAVKKLDFFENSS